MNNIRINIAISGLSSSSTDQLKICLRQILPTDVGINWSNIADQNIDCLFVHEHFYDSDHVQRIIVKQNTPYLKISRNNPPLDQPNRDTLYLPIQADEFFQNWMTIHVLQKLDRTFLEDNTLDITLSQIEHPIEIDEIKLSIIQDLYQYDTRKFHLTDQQGTLAITDRRNHQVWLDPSRSEIRTSGAAHCADAVLTDFDKVSRKNAYNLENWMFTLGWNSKITSEMPHENDYYKLNYWPQLLDDQSKNIVIKLSASFILGAQISEVASHFDIPVNTVQKFIATNIVFDNAFIVSAQQSLFKKQNLNDIPQQEQSVVKSFFGRLKKRFGF